VNGPGGLPLDARAAIVTVFLAALALGEAVEPHHWWAGALIIAGVYLGIRADPRRRQG
jgi:drug/metabolite transporter (DMT)-like permease